LDDQDPRNEREISQLTAAFGEPTYRERTIIADKYLYASRLSRSRNECVLLHRKGWYERGVYRLPTGGVEWGEDIEEALIRELEEETGYFDGNQRFIAILDCSFVFQSDQVRFISYLFYLRDLKGTLRLPSSKEDISDFRDIALGELPAVAENLRQVPPPRTGWGEWRAFAHELAYEILVEDC
jgi:ADP-ribose pyrophosphatase YjhB (NUDIX family)